MLFTFTKFSGEKQISLVHLTPLSRWEILPTRISVNSGGSLKLHGAGWGRIGENFTRGEVGLTPSAYHDEAFTLTKIKPPIWAQEIVKIVYHNFFKSLFFNVIFFSTH